MPGHRKKRLKKEGKTMYYLRIPDSVKVGKDPEGGTAPVVTFEEFMRDVVWPHETWRSGKDARSLCRSMEAKFEGKLPHDVVELTDKEFETIFPIATLKGQKLDPRVNQALMKLMDAFIFADTTPPKEN